MIGGALILALGVVVVAPLAHHLAKRPITDGVDIAALRVGDCVRTMTGADGFAPDSVDVVDCAKPHGAEVYAAFTLREGSYPGQHRVDVLTERGCDRRFAGYVGASAAQTTLDIYITSPSKENWSFDHDRGVLCTVESPDDPTTGSVRHSGR